MKYTYQMYYREIITNMKTFNNKYYQVCAQDFQKGAVKYEVFS